MQALLTQLPGGWENTSLAEVAEPTAGPGEVLVEIQAVGLNPADYFQIEGKYPGGPKPPFVAGRDAAGVVLEDQSGRWQIGAPVVVLLSSATNLAAGTLAQRQRFFANQLAPLPAGWSIAEGGAAPLVYQTAWAALIEFGKLQAGQSVLVTGASGGVGLAAVHLAAGLGATVIGLSRLADKRDRLLKSGASFVFDPDSPGLRKEIEAALAGRGVDLVVENVGGAAMAQSVRLLGFGGKLALVGLLAGVDGVLPIPSVLFKRLTIQGVLVSDKTPDQARVDWSNIVATLDRSKRRPMVDSQFSLADFPKAFDRLRASPFGKVVIQTDSPANT